MSEETFRWVVAGGVGLAALAFVVMGIVAVVLASLFSKLKAKIDPILDSVQPIIRNVGETVVLLKPKVARVSEQAVEVVGLVATEAHRYSDLSKDVADRARARVARVDAAVDETIENVQEAGGAVKSAVLRPFREIDGVLTGIRTAFYCYTRGGRRTTVSTATQDEELFI